MPLVDSFIKESTRMHACTQLAAVSRYLIRDLSITHDALGDRYSMSCSDFPAQCYEINHALRRHVYPEG